MHVIATAGHVDHGKSTLVRVLTGTDPDRLEEERRRGLTIDLGFAGTTLPSGRGVAFVDVPGHVRFLENMLAGVGAVDACVFVVAATEGWKPQSEEHLRILELLGVSHGLVVLTKVGLVDGDLRELARLDLEEHLAGSFLAGAEVVEVDAPTGEGLVELRDALDRLTATAPVALDRGRPRLWVDRSFAPPGAGTVVTGTLTGGRLAVDDDVEITPAGRTARVRGLQRLHESVDALPPGNRTAINLGGIGHDDIWRGHAVVRPGQWHLTTTVDAELDVLAATDRPVSRRGAHLAYIGSGEHPVRLRVLGPDAIGPGERGLVRLHLAERLPLVPGDRFVLRDAGPNQTVGGGTILDVDPVIPAGRARPDRRVERVIAERGWIEVDQLERLTGERRPAVVGRWVVDPDALEAVQRQVRAAVTDAGPLGLDVASLDERERAVLDGFDDLEVERGRARFRDAGDPLADHPFLRALDASPFRPPSPADGGVDPAELRGLVNRGLVIDADGVVFSAGAIDQAARVVAGLLSTRPDGFTVAEARDALGTTRKYVIPLLSHLDATGRTRRRDDLRIAGPRLDSGD